MRSRFVSSVSVLRQGWLRKHAISPLLTSLIERTSSMIILVNHFSFIQWEQFVLLGRLSTDFVSNFAMHIILA